jgi:hypothetical protein
VRIFLIATAIALCLNAATPPKFAALAFQPRNGVTITGSVNGCAARLPGIRVLVFDGAESQKLNELIREADSAVSTDDTEIARRGWQAIDNLVAFARKAPNIGTAKSDKAGSFRAQLTRHVNNVIVFVYAESEEGPPFDYAYARVPADKMSAPIVISFC